MHVNVRSLSQSHSLRSLHLFQTRYAERSTVNLKGMCPFGLNVLYYSGVSSFRRQLRTSLFKQARNHQDKRRKHIQRRRRRRSPTKKQIFEAGGQRIDAR